MKGREAGGRGGRGAYPFCCFPWSFDHWSSIAFEAEHGGGPRLVTR